MSVQLQKGEGFNAEYASTDFPTLSADWTGSVSLYLAYPGTASLTKALVRSGNVMQLSLTAAEILNLADGSYYFVTTITNAVLGVTVTTVQTATVLPIAAVGGVDYCVISMTIAKVDGTPAGFSSHTVVNTATGSEVAYTWNGVKVTVSHAIADETSGKIIGTETLNATTNSSGFVSFSVIRGKLVTVTCPSFGKSVAVDTTGLATVDLSTYFD